MNQKLIKKNWNYILDEDPNLYFTTYDLGLSAALLSIGHKLYTVEKEDPRRALFVFKKENDIQNDANNYFQNTLEVLARSYFDHLKALKNKLYSE